METEKKFVRDFWNNYFSELNSHNKIQEDITDSPENFVKRLEEISTRKKVSFTHKMHKGSMADVKGEMILTNSFGEKFKIYFNSEIRFEKNTKLKIVYIELSKLFYNDSEFLTNIFFQNLPYEEIEMLIDYLYNYKENFEVEFLKFQKMQKMIQLTETTIKSLLYEKFKNTKYTWKISKIVNSSDISYKITLNEFDEEVSILFVDQKDLVKKITEWEF